MKQHRRREKVPLSHHTGFFFLSLCALAGLIPMINNDQQTAVSLLSVRLSFVPGRTAGQ